MHAAAVRGAAETPGPTTRVVYAQVGANNGRRNDCHYTGQVGDEGQKSDVLFEVETDKATLEVESPADGCVKAILIDVGQTVPVNEPLLVLADRDEQVPQRFITALVHEGTAPAETVPEHVTAEEHAAAAPETMPSSPPPKPTAPMEPAERLFATPRAKLIAQELGIDLRGVTPANAIRIVEADVRAP